MVRQVLQWLLNFHIARVLQRKHFSFRTLWVIWCVRFHLVVHISLFHEYLNYCLDWSIILILLSRMNLNLNIEQLSRIMPKWLHQFHEFLNHQGKFEYWLLSSFLHRRCLFKFVYSNLAFLILIACCRFFDHFESEDTRLLTLSTACRYIVQW